MITITTDPPAATVALNLAEWGHLVQDWTPVWDAIREVYNRHQLRQFVSEGAWTGARWAPLSARYSTWKERVAPGQPILVLTGRLRTAATGGGGAIRRQDATSMEVGVDGAAVPHAKYHQQGTPKMPARPVIRFDGSPLGDRSVMSGRSPGTFGYAVRQLMQAHVVRARRASFGHDTAAADATFARVRRAEVK